MKMLYILNTTNKVNNFSYSSMLAARELNIEFHIAGNWTGYDNPKDKEADEIKYGIKIHQIDFIRQPYDLRNIKAYNQVVELIKKEKYDVIHCNTPIGGVVGRLAGKRSGVKKVIYQAHGFHFYKGAPIFNWLVYYPIERWLARYTDALITINTEDYNRAQHFKLRSNGKKYYVPGVGIDLNKFDNPIDRNIKRRELGVSESDTVLISIGDLNKNKNHKVVISAMHELNNPDIYYILCGEGKERPKLERLTQKYNLSNNVKFLGYRKDISELLQASDIYLMPSFREGLSRSLMEAMACGLPCIVSNIRGNVDLILNDLGGYLVKPNDKKGFSKAVSLLRNNKMKILNMSKENKKKINEYSIEKIQNDIKDIYFECLTNF